MKERIRTIVASLGAVIALTTVAACTGEPAEPHGSSSPLPSRSATPEPSILPEAPGTGVAMRLADDVVPPTNRWYSSLAFGEPGLPVFPTPLSFAAVDGGFTVGLTRPVASAAAILAPAMADVTVTIAGASGYGEVVSATPVGASLSLGPAVATIAQGVPAVALSSDGGIDATLSAAFTPAGESVATATVAGTEYGITVRDGTIDGAALTLRPGGVAHLFAVPDGGDAASFAEALGAPPRDADATFSLGQSATTTIRYGDEPTVVAVPGERVGDLECDLGTYATIHGPYTVCRAAEVSWDVPLVSPAAGLDLSAITDPERDAILTALATESEEVPALPADTYFGSKALYRLAAMLEVADALGEEATASRLQSVLVDQLDLWGDPEGCLARAERCFTYDPSMRGVVGLATAFGSEEFNDHHFHYGYLLYAAAVAGQRDPAFAERVGPVMDLVAEDIAAPVASDAFPVRRAFDPVAGHSWASGISPFADGNNQESSSEAALAWNAVALWAEVREDGSLADSARWMLAAESEAARRLWLEPDLSPFPEFDHRIVAIEWGAKRDYATWFSPEPAAMLGIQIIPGQPTAMESLASVTPEHISASVAEAWGQAMPDQFADLLLMYQALAGEEARQDAWARAVELPAEAIDDGLSRTWLLAWIASAG